MKQLKAYCIPKRPISDLINIEQGVFILIQSPSRNTARQQADVLSAFVKIKDTQGTIHKIKREWKSQGNNSGVASNVPPGVSFFKSLPDIELHLDPL